LVDDLTSGKPVPEIAARFGVSRQRVYQWRTSLGFETRAWTPRPEILRLVDE
jgi:transposase-like protein